MKHRLLTAATRSTGRETSGRWLCGRCRARQTRSMASIAPLPSSGTDTVRMSTSSHHKQFADMKEIRLPHAIPPQLLAHVDDGALNEQELEEKRHLFRWAMKGHVNSDFQPKSSDTLQIKGVVVSAGKMNRTVKVRVPGQRFDRRVKKNFTTYANHLVHDPNDSLREGDVVAIHRSAVSKTVKHIIAAIISPFGTPLHERPPIPSPEERLRTYKEKRIQRLDNRMAAVQAAAKQGKAQAQLQGGKSDETRRITEAMIQQAENYRNIWMQRHKILQPPRLRRQVKKKSVSAKSARGDRGGTSSNASAPEARRGKTLLHGEDSTKPVGA